MLKLWDYFPNADFNPASVFLEKSGERGFDLRFMNLPPHTHKRTFRVPYQGYHVTLIVLAYREIDDAFARSCFDDWMRSRGRKKMKEDMVVTFPTLLGV